jgi:hypothetical protein
LPGIVQIVSAISEVVVDLLADAGYAPLTDGKILLGRQHHAEHSAPPRIVIIPLKSTFGPKDVYSASRVAQNHPYGPEALAQIRQRSIATDRVTFEVRCWGVSPKAEPDPDDDIDVTQALYQAVIEATHLLLVGSYELGRGEWIDAREGTTQHVHLGREFVFELTVATPVLDKLLPVAPSDVRGALSNTMIRPDGAASTGCD